MTKIISKLLLKRKGKFTFLSLLILYSLLLSENVLSQQQWSRDYIKMKYVRAENSIYLKIKFFQYEFGPFGEHGFLEWLDIFYSLNPLESSEDQNYIKLMSCETEDQLYLDISLVIVKSKILNANIQFYGCHHPTAGSVWNNHTNVRVTVANDSKEASFIIKWRIPDSFLIHHIMVNGNWRVNGLYCNHSIKDQKYLKRHFSDFDIPGNTVSKRTNMDIPHNDQFENNAVKVYKEADAVVINGADPGENIQVYTTNGTQINATIANKDEVKIKLPTNQIYFVLVGQNRYKVAL